MPAEQMFIVSLQILARWFACLIVYKIIYSSYRSALFGEFALDMSRFNYKDGLYGWVVQNMC
jgi:hypothetical protein